MTENLNAPHDIADAFASGIQRKLNIANTSPKTNQIIMSDLLSPEFDRQIIQLNSKITKRHEVSPRSFDSHLPNPDLHPS
jgi:hypothetical protein